MMKVERGNVINFVNAYNKNSAKINKSNDVNKVGDKVEISKLGKQLSEYQNDIRVNREEKIKEIRESIEKGTYKADGKKIASKMLEEMKNK